MLTLFLSCNVYWDYSLQEMVLNFSISPTERLFSTKAELYLSEVKNGQIDLYLYERAKIKRLEINDQTTEFSFSDGRILITNISAKSFRLFLEYQFTLPQKDIENIYSNYEDPSAHILNLINDDFVFFGKDFYWYPQTADQPERIKLTVTSNDDMKYISMGELKGIKQEKEFTQSQWLINNPKTRLVLIGGRYYSGEKDYKGRVKIYTFFSKENAALSSKYIDAVYKYLELYEERIGFYPYEKFAVVESKTPVGLSYPSLAVLGKNIIKLPFILDTSLPHEIVHCYFGNGVFVDYGKGNWSEGLATYLADYYIKELNNSEEALNYRKKLTFDYAILVDKNSDIPLSRFYGRVDVSTRAIGYGKSAMFFHYLRYMLGDEVFFKALTKFFKENLFKKAGWQDLQKSFEVVSKRDLNNIFSAWIEKKGVPEIEIQYAKLVKKQAVYQLNVGLKQKGEIYDLLLPFWVEFGDGRKVFVQNISFFSPRQEFQMVFNEKPRYVYLDPEFHIIKNFDREELPPTINNLKSVRDVYIMKNKNYKGTDRSIEILLSTLGIKKFDPLPRERILKREKPIIYFGYNELEVEDIKIFKDRFTYKGMHFSEKDALFLIFYNNKELIAIFYPLSPEVSEKVAPKITHYGQFSYLVFKDGVIYQKGAWEQKLTKLRKELKLYE